MNEREKQFSFTRAASSTSGRAKNQIPISCRVFGVGLAVLLTGCGTIRLPPPQVKPIGSYQHVQTLDGITLAVDPMTDAAEVKRQFGTDLLGANILPVFVVATNQSGSGSLLISAEQFTLGNGTTQAGGGQLNQATSTQGLEAAGLIGLMAGGLLLGAPAGSALIDRQAINQNFRHQELARMVLPLGAGAHGYVYFRLPQKLERRPDWVVVFQIKTLQSEGGKELRFPFDWH